MSAKIIQLAEYSQEIKLNRVRRVKAAFANQYRVAELSKGRVKWPWNEEEYLQWREYVKAPRRWINSGKLPPAFVQGREYFPGDRKWYKFMDHASYWCAIDAPNSKFIVSIPYGTWEFEQLDDFCAATRTVVRLLPKELSFKYFHLALPLVTYREEDRGMDDRFGHLPKARTLLEVPT